MNKTSIARTAVLIGYFGLLFLLLSWYTVLQPPTYFPISLVIILLVGPLLFPLRGLLHGRPYTHVWTSYLSLFYFIHGVGEAYSNPAARWLAILEIVFAVSLYTGAIFYARLRGRELRREAQSSVADR